MSSLMQGMAVEAYRFGTWEGPDASAGAVCALTGVSASGVPKFSSVLGAGALPAVKTPLYVLQGKVTTGGTATAGDNVRVLERGMVRGITFPGGAPTPGAATPVYFGTAGDLDLTPSALGTWLLGYVVAVGVSTYDAWFDGGMQWGNSGGSFSDNGTPGAICADLTAAIAGDTLTITSGGAPVVYEFTNTGIVAPGNVAVDIATMDAVFPGIIAANQSELTAYCATKHLLVAVKLAAAVQIGQTLTVANTGASTSAVAVTAVAAKRLSVQHIKVELTATSLVTGAVVPLPTTGTLRAFWSSMWINAPGKVTAPVDLQLIQIGSDMVILPLAGAAGNHVDLFMLLEY